jgi:hypothetical protein
MTIACARADGNLDAMVLNVLKYCHANGIDTSASIVARKMGGA